MCSVEHIPGPPSFLELKVLLFSKLIAFNLSNYKKGEVVTKTVSEGKITLEVNYQIIINFCTRGLIEVCVYSK